MARRVRTYAWDHEQHERAADDDKGHVPAVEPVRNEASGDKPPCGQAAAIWAGDSLVGIQVGR